MSEAALTPTLSNFDAIVAAKSAALDAKPSDPVDDAPDTQEAEHEIGDSELEEVEPEAEPEAEQADEDDEDEQSDDPTVEPAEKALAAPFKAFRESLKSKRVTPELMTALGDLELEVETVNGPVKMRLQEMGGHVMREARFTREMQKAKEAQAGAQRIHQIEQARTNAWRQSPRELQQGLQIMGCGEALNALHRQWAEETYSYLSQSPERRAQIDQERQWQQRRAQEEMRFHQLQQETRKLEQQRSAQQFDEPTRQAGDFINQNLDRVLGGALKEHGAGKINNDLRLQMINEATELAQEGYALPQALAEAARTVAEKERRLKRMAQGQHQEQAKAKPEVSGRRAPAGNPPPKRDDSGRFQPPSRPMKRSKAAATAAEFGRRFGV